MLLAARARALGLVSPGCPEAAIWARFSSTALLRERLRAYWREAMKRATIRWARGELVAQAVWMTCSSKLGNTSGSRAMVRPSPLDPGTLHQRPKRCQGNRGWSRGPNPLTWREVDAYCGGGQNGPRLGSIRPGSTLAVVPRRQVRRGRPPSPPRADTDKGQPSRCAGRMRRRDCRADNRLRTRDARGTMVRAKVSFVSWLPPRSQCPASADTRGLGSPPPLPSRQDCMRHAMDRGD